MEQAVWINQSPGAVGRHTQTEKMVSMNRKTNTEHIVTKSIGTQIGQQMELEADSADRNSQPSNEHEIDNDVVSFPQAGVAGEGPADPHKLVGISGLSTLLKSLEVPCLSMDQFGINILDKNRNQKARGIIEIGSTGEQNDYWAVFDDISVMVEKNGNALTTG
jgi:hypothetical protein